MTISKFKISNKVLSVLLCLALLLSYVPLSSLTVFAAASSVEISTLSDLQSFKSRIESGEGSLDAVLTANIDMSSVTDWNGIGTTKSPYTGTFDGQGYTISNLIGSMGLFTESSGTVKNVYMKNVSIDGGGNNGAVVGHNTGTVLNCVSMGTVSGNSWSVGGIVGYNEGGAVRGCISSCTVSGGTAGGLIGSNWGNGHISYCYYSGTNANIEGDSNYAKASSEAVYFQTGSDYQLYNNDSAVSAEIVVATVNTYITNNGGYFKLSDSGNTVLFPHASHPVCGAAHTDIGNHTGECGNITWTAWNSTNSLPTEAGNYYLAANVTVTGDWDVPSGETKICLNGYTLKTTSVIAQGEILTICDCQDTGEVYSGSSGFYNSRSIVNNSGTFNLYGGALSSNFQTTGGAAGVRNKGTFNMYGGSITKNTASAAGGGVYNESGATFNLYGGSITKNSGGTGGGLYNAGKFNMYGGSITGNKTDMNSYGGIYSANRINISGKVVINGNTNKNGDPSNYCSSSNGAVMIVGTLEVGSSIGVTRYNNIGTITTGGDEYIDYFFSDNAQYFVEKDGENLKLSEKEFAVDVTVNDNAYGTASANKTSGTKGTQVLLTAEPAKGYRLKEWKLISGGGSLYQSGIFYIGTENAEIQAVFEQAASYTVQFNAGGGTGSKDSITVFEGDSYILPANPFTAPTGKQFKAWNVGDKEYAVGDTITVSADMTVTAVWENIPAEMPTVTAGENLTLTYKSYTDKQVSVTVIKKDGYTYSYQWYDGNGQSIGGATDNTYTVPNDLTVGSYKYYCKVTAKRNDNALAESTDSEKITVTVNQAAATLTAPTAQNEITYGAKLSTVGLNDGWVWANGDTVPTVNNNGYLAYYTPADTDNYDWTTIDGWNETENRVERTVPVTVNKAPLTVKAKNKTITYGDAPTNDGVTYVGFVNDESETALGGTLAYDYGYTQYGDVGEFNIIPKGLSSDNYTITFEKGTLTVNQKEINITWSNTEFTYNGTAHKPTATTADFVPNDNVALTVSGEQTDANKDGESYTATVTITGAKAGNYKFAESAATTTQFTIKKADQNAPAVQSTNETISGKKDGVITAVNSTMEYRKDGESTYTAISGETVTDLAAGKYYVRVKGDSNHNPSPDTEVTIAAGRKLTVTIPTAQEQIGYTLTVDKNELDWQGQLVITFALADGYSKSETDFAVKVNGSAITLDENEQYIVTGAETDLTITVAGVVDETAPEAEIAITTNKWTEFLKDITFGLFFKETQDVTIIATDKGSGVDKIYYYISEDVLTEDEVKALATDKWTEYDADNKPSIDPDKECVVYVKATDKAQSVKFISSTGLVFDGTAPALVGIENGGIYYGDKIFKALDDNFLKIEVDGTDITDTTQGDDEYKIVADNVEHTVTVTDKAGNITEWKITVYKQYTVTFIVDGETLTTKTVNHKADAEMPEIPEKEGYTQTAPVWDKDGKEITEDTTITAVYTVNEYTVTFMDENGVYKTVTVKHGEKVTMPEAPTKDGYTVTWEKEIDTVTADVTVKAVYTKIPVADTNSPQTGDNSNLWLWFALLFISGGGVIGTTLYGRKRKTEEN